MAGGLYIWIMGGIFISFVVIASIMALIFWFGHRMEKKETGATHGFLELPKDAQSRPAPRSDEITGIEPTARHEIQK